MLAPNNGRKNIRRTSSPRDGRLNSFTSLDLDARAGKLQAGKCPTQLSPTPPCEAALSSFPSHGPNAFSGISPQVRCARGRKLRGLQEATFRSHSRRANSRKPRSAHTPGTPGRKLAESSGSILFESKKSAMRPTQLSNIQGLERAPTRTPHPT